MSTIWEVLGLDGPSTDDRAIKKAYATRLREARPESDQAGFMRLRDAFDRARTYARLHAEDGHSDMGYGGAESAIELDFVEHTFEKSRETNSDAAVEFATVELDARNSESDLRDIMGRRIASLLRSPWTINSRAAWEDLFNSPELSAIDSETEFRDILRTSLLALMGFFGSSDLNGKSKTQKLNANTARYVFDRMEWTDPSRFYEPVQSEIIWLGQELNIPLKHEATEQELALYNDAEDEGGNIVFYIICTVIFVVIVQVFVQLGKLGGS